jgi:hypothetical protein
LSFYKKSCNSYRGNVKKIKLERSEWKDDFQEENEYGKAVKENLGIELGKMENNFEERAVSKIWLNCLWGKVDQMQSMGE